MSYAWQWIKSLIFNILIFSGMAVLGILFFPWALFSREGARKACQTYVRFVRWCCEHIVGIKWDIRGTPPTGEVMIAAKHQSFLDILMIFGAIPRGKFIMKKQLVWFPFVGVYALRIGCIPVDRGKRAQAITKMKADVEAGRSDPGQLVIYPQGTRIPAGKKAPYKIGTGVLYEQLEQPVVPVAANVGLFWPVMGVYRHPGNAVVEFLEPIQPGLDAKTVIKQIEDQIETASDKLIAEANLPERMAKA